MAESEVQVNDEGTGPKIATVAVDRPQDVDASGNAQDDETVHQQVVSTADHHGDLIRQPRNVESLLELILEELIKLNMQFD